MHIPPAPADGRRPRLLAFARSHEAELYIVRTHLTAPETASLQVVLDQLVEMGVVALYRLDAPMDDAASWQRVVDHLRKQLGSICADAAIAAAAHPATTTPKPQTLVPVWPFDRLADDFDVLTACGLFMRAPIVIEALPVLDADLTEPAPNVVERLAAWRAALGRDVALGTVAIPGEEAAHVVFASTRAG